METATYQNVRTRGFASHGAKPCATDAVTEPEIYPVGSDTCELPRVLVGFNIEALDLQAPVAGRLDRRH